MAEHPTEDGTAMARVFDFGDLADLILSNLGVRDLFTVAAVSRKFRTAVRSSLSSQQTLFLHKRPILSGRWLMLHHTRRRQPYDEEPAPSPVCTIAPRPTAKSFVGARGLKIEDIEHLTELCHWLIGCQTVAQARFLKANEPILHERLRLATLLSYAKFPTEPGEDSLFAAMLLTSPPCHDASIYLSYVHDEDKTSLCVQRIVHDSVALTVGSLLRAAHQMRGQVTLTRVIGGIEYEHKLEDTSFEAELINQEFRGGRFSMDLQKTQIFFSHKQVIITPEVWKELQRKQMRSDFEGRAGTGRG